MTHTERYKTAERVDMTEALTALRAYIGELEDLRTPTMNEVEDAVDTIFPNLLVAEKAKIVESFLSSETSAADEANRQAEAAKRKIKKSTLFSRLFCCFMV